MDEAVGFGLCKGLVLVVLWPWNPDISNLCVWVLGLRIQALVLFLWRWVWEAWGGGLLVVLVGPLALCLKEL